MPLVNILSPGKNTESLVKCLLQTSITFPSLSNGQFDSLSSLDGYNEQEYNQARKGQHQHILLTTRQISRR